jgi:hypothetical protein
MGGGESNESKRRALRPSIKIARVRVELNGASPSERPFCFGSQRENAGPELPGSPKDVQRRPREPGALGIAHSKGLTQLNQGLAPKSWNAEEGLRVRQYLNSPQAGPSNRPCGRLVKFGSHPVQRKALLNHRQVLAAKVIRSDEERCEVAALASSHASGRRVTASAARLFRPKNFRHVCSLPSLVLTKEQTIVGAYTSCMARLMAARATLWMPVCS